MIARVCLRVRGQEDQGSKVRRWHRLEHLLPSLSSGRCRRRRRRRDVFRKHGEHGDSGFESNFRLRVQSALVARPGVIRFTVPPFSVRSLLCAFSDGVLYRRL